MASLTNSALVTKAHPSVLLRWLLRTSTARPGKPRERRLYPPKRDKVIEDAAMAREMFRL